MNLAPRLLVASSALVFACLGAPLDPVAAGASTTAVSTTTRPGPDDQVDYVADMEFALDELEARCGHFFEQKDIDWKKVRKEMLKAVKDVEDDNAMWFELQRLIARLEDGHARVTPLVEGLEWPDDTRREYTGPGLFLCQVGKKIYVKNSFGTGASARIEPGSEIIKINGKKPGKWLEERVARERELFSFSTDQQALFHTMHWGMSDTKGAKLTLKLKEPSGKKADRNLTYQDATTVPWGPAYFPPGMQGDKNVSWTTLESGFGYIHIRRCKSDLPERFDEALAALGEVPGVVLDFRANGGGGFDHDGLFGRFLEPGERFGVGKTYEHAGEAAYTGPVVTIIDGNVRSAGETAAGIFKEDGRAYMIGESPTAGMSASKQDLELPSGRFSLYFAVRSNKSRFNQGRGIEGIGVIPHEELAYDPGDLAAERDTFILRAEELLVAYPKSGFPQTVPYKAR